jgi:hypothetical protein
MSHPDPSPQVTGDDLRQALARDGGPRGRQPLTLLDATPRTPEAPAWDWDASTDREQAELADLRATVEQLTGELASAREHASRSAAQAAELGDALEQLAGTRAWSRRRVIAQLRERSLLRR